MKNINYLNLYLKYALFYIKMSDAGFLAFPAFPQCGGANTSLRGRAAELLQFIMGNALQKNQELGLYLCDLLTQHPDIINKILPISQPNQAITLRHMADLLESISLPQLRGHVCPVTCSWIDAMVRYANRINFQHVPITCAPEQHTGYESKSDSSPLTGDELMEYVRRSDARTNVLGTSTYLAVPPQPRDNTRLSPVNRQ